MLNYYGMVVWVLRRVYHCVIINVNLLWNVHMSITKDLLLYYKECEIDTKHLNEYYEWSTIEV